MGTRSGGRNANAAYYWRIAFSRLDLRGVDCCSSSGLRGPAPTAWTAPGPILLVTITLSHSRCHPLPQRVTSVQTSNLETRDSDVASAPAMARHPRTPQRHHSTPQSLPFAQERSRQGRNPDLALRGATAHIRTTGSERRCQAIQHTAPSTTTTVRTFEAPDPNPNPNLWPLRGENPKWPVRGP